MMSERVVRGGSSREASENFKERGQYGGHGKSRPCCIGSNAKHRLPSEPFLRMVKSENAAVFARDSGRSNLCHHCGILKQDRRRLPSQ